MDATAVINAPLRTWDVTTTVFYTGQFWSVNAAAKASLWGRRRARFVIRVGNWGYGGGWAALVERGAASIVKTVISTKEYVTIVSRPGGNKLAARYNIFVSGVSSIKFGINNSFAVISALICHVWIANQHLVFWRYTKERNVTHYNSRAHTVGFHWYLYIHYSHALSLLVSTDSLWIKISWNSRYLCP